MPDAPERSSDFRYFASDAIGMAFNDNGCRIIFGIEEKPGHIIEQCGVFITHKTMKLLATMLSLTIEHYENTSGEVIAIDPDAVKRLQERFSSPSQSDPDPTA